MTALNAACATAAPEAAATTAWPAPTVAPVRRPSSWPCRDGVAPAIDRSHPLRTVKVGPLGPDDVHFPPPHTHGDHSVVRRELSILPRAGAGSHYCAHQSAAQLGDSHPGNSETASRCPGAETTMRFLMPLRVVTVRISRGWSCTGSGCQACR